MNKIESSENARTSCEVMKYGMWAWRAAMLIPVAAFFAMGDI